MNKVNEPTTIRDTAQWHSISEHRHSYRPTPTRGQARQEHVSTKSLDKETCYQAARSHSDQTPPRTKQHFQGGQRRSLRTTTTPYMPRTTQPPQIALLSGLYSCILYYYLFCFIVFYLTPVLIRFVKICVCRDLYTSRERMHIARP